MHTDTDADTYAHTPTYRYAHTPTYWHIFRRPGPLALVLALAGALVTGPAHALAGQPSVPCTGRLQLSPAATRIGGALLLRGSRYTCAGPTGFLPQARVILYKPNLGFKVYPVTVARTGVYVLHIHVPAVLTAASDLMTGKRTTVLAQPGTYYVTVRVFDMDLPAPDRANATFKVLAPPRIAASRP